MGEKLVVESDGEYQGRKGDLGIGDVKWSVEWLGLVKKPCTLIIRRRKYITDHPKHHPPGKTIRRPRRNPQSLATIPKSKRTTILHPAQHQKPQTTISLWIRIKWERIRTDEQFYLRTTRKVSTTTKSYRPTWIIVKAIGAVGHSARSLKWIVKPWFIGGSRRECTFGRETVNNRVAGYLDLEQYGKAGWDCWVIVTRECWVELLKGRAWESDSTSTIRKL